MQNCFLNYHFYSKLAYYKQQQQSLVDKMTSRSSALAAIVDCCLTRNCSGSQCIAASSIVRKRRLGLFGHVARLTEEIPANQILRTCCEAQDGA